MDNSDLLEHVEFWSCLMHQGCLLAGHTELQPEGSAATSVCGSWWMLAGHCIPCIPWGTPSTDPGAAGLCWLLQERALSLPRERLHQMCHRELLSSRKYCFITGNQSVSLLLIKMWERKKKFLTWDLHFVLRQEVRLPSVIKVFPDGTLNWQF